MNRFDPRVPADTSQDPTPVTPPGIRIPGSRLQSAETLPLGRDPQSFSQTESLEREELLVALAEAWYGVSRLLADDLSQATAADCISYHFLEVAEGIAEARQNAKGPAVEAPGPLRSSKGESNADES